MKSKLFIQGSLTIIFVNTALLSGCATEPLPALEEARQEVTQAHNDPIVAENAPVALYDAEQSLKEADQLWEAQEDEDEVEHLAYLTKGKVAIAKYTAQRKVADDQLKVLENNRKKLILETRKNEVKEARKKVQSLEEQLKDLKAKKTDRGLVVTIGDVLFDTGKADLKSSALQNLYRLVTALKEYETRNVLIEGHTDNVGSEEYNINLSRQRAQAVANFLLSNGIEASRVITQGYGEAYPASSNKTAIGRQQNRRVEIIILDEGESHEKYLRH